MVFTILTPNYVHYSAGVGCLYYLGDLLTELGHTVYQINFQRGKTPLPEWSKMIPEKNGYVRGIIIAPETVPELPGMEHVRIVRWCLNNPGLLGGPVRYSPNTKVMHFGPPFEEAARAAAPDGVSYELMLGTMDPASGVDKGSYRPFTVYYRGKYKGVLTPEHNDEVEPMCIEMTRQWPPTKPQYFRLLSRTRDFFSYDSVSAVNTEAHLSGCHVHIRNGDRWDRYHAPAFSDRVIRNRDRDRAAVESAVKYMLGEGTTTAIPPPPADLTVEQWHASALKEAADGRLEIARESLKALVAKHPNHHVALNDLGVLCYQTRCLDQAVAYTEQAASSMPNHTNTLRNLLDLYVVLKREADAKRICQRLLELDPGDTEARQVLDRLGAADSTPIVLETPPPDAKTTGNANKVAPGDKPQ